MHVAFPSCFVLIYAVTQACQGVRPRRGMSYEDMVVRRILDAYKARSNHARPVKMFNDTLTVQFAVQLQQLLGLDEQNQVLTLSIWDQREWQDVHLSWDILEYGGVSDVRVPCNKIWTPDIKLHNYADLRLAEHRDALCIINSSGFIYHMPQVVYKSSCLLKVDYFPFDIQNCTLKFGSWTYSGSQLDLQFFKNKRWIDMTEYIQSPSWRIIDCPGIRHVRSYSCCPNEHWVDLQYHLIFQRRSALYNYILILPCILLTSITLILFWIPPESPAKMQLGLTVFIAFFILLKLLEKNLPPGASHMPLLGTYYCLNMILITLSSFLNVLVVDLTAHGLRASTPPAIRNFFFNYLAKCLLMQDLVRPFKASAKPKSRTPKELTFCKVEGSKWVHETDQTTEAVIQLQRDQSIQIGGPLAEIDGKLCELRDFVRLQKQRLKERDSREVTAKQWKAVALILDRIFLIIYLIIIIASLSYTIPVLISNGNGYNSTVLEIARTSY